MKKKRINKRFIIVICLIMLSYFIVTAISIYSYSEYDNLTKADVVIVLGAAVWGEEPSPVFKARIDHGIWLYKNGYVSKIIFTGGQGKEQETAESIVAKKYAEKNMIPSKDILIETKSKITEQNISYAKQIVQDNGLDSSIIVSDPLHMKRAMLMAEDYGLEAYSSPTPTSRYKTWKSKGKFLLREVYYYIGYKIYRIIN
ncbi:YdcF family protein [Clostridium sp. D2Q-11]|uniref:YdcF family protein n=1 Tax=Anaeromonas frigoriresistens TaxID=2683708 RepID=A0A942UST9_9FIRM|nr:YdcF family protein [Anaeromonas frigoriresistens]MBS4537300.1 YdcF family protein [Anaeromonas frigoriresistens]